MKDALKDCVPVLSSIFVKWKWLVIWIVGILFAVSALSYQSGRVIAMQNSRIIKNSESFQKISEKMEDIDNKLDSILIKMGVRE